MTLVSGSTPNVSEFDPRNVPYQARVMDDMAHSMDFGLGVHEILLSGSVGSAKSILAAHVGILHCLKFPKARLGIHRKAMPDLRDTIYTKICEHLSGTPGLEEGKHYFCRDTTCQITFFNGSEIIAKSWADGDYKKLGSIELSAAIVEELTENDDDDEMALKYLRMRVGRLPHIKQSWIMYCTNPDSPAHFAYKYFDIGQRQIGKLENLPRTRHVYFSNTFDNKFLPKTYIEGLMQNLDAKLVERMVYGKWIELTKDRVYYSYSELNYKNESYEVDTWLPIGICFDFNIGQGKPMSLCVVQYDPKKDTFHFFGECIVEGADTEAILEEAAELGFLEHDTEYEIFGDATGDHKSTNSKKTNYDIIMEYLAKYRQKSGQRLRVKRRVPKSNPPIRDRHNIVNGYCRNAFGKTRFYVYKDAATLHDGMRLVELKKGGKYIEDDSKAYQHVTTAAGYCVVRVHKDKQKTQAVRTEQIR